jgi:ABC-type uncharacterized transport system involved in gliding motility auxiliary subunit
MSRIQALKILNPILFLLIAFQIVSGLTLLVSYQVHQTLGLVIAGGVLLHLVLNWAWIRTNIFRWRK